MSFGTGGPPGRTRLYTIEPGDPRWHDQSMHGQPFTCDHCGAQGSAGEADARCRECGRTTYLPIEMELRVLDPSDRREAKREIVDLVTVSDLRDIGRDYGISYSRGSTKDEMVDQLISQDPNVALGLYESGSPPY